MDAKPIALGLALFAGLTAAVLVLRPRPPAREAAPVASASAASSGAETPEADSGPAPSASVEPEEVEVDAPDGGSLPPGAPKQVGFGVILFQYEGAQNAPKGIRTKAEALALARASLEEARADFASAVKRGDPASKADMGRITRGILEPHVERVLFSLAKGEVCKEPVDTPRGYWVVRRTE